MVEWGKKCSEEYMDEEVQWSTRQKEFFLIYFIHFVSVCARFLFSIFFRQVSRFSSWFKVERDYSTHTVWAAPLALRSLLHIRVKTDHVVGSGTGVAQNDLSSLLTHLTVVLMVRLITIALFCFN